LEASPVLAPFGHKSADGSAVLGREGYVFLYGGSNNVLSLYTDTGNEPLVRQKVAGWTELFARRAAALADRGIAYLQCVIPEKSTVLPSLAPAELTPVTPYLKLLEAEMAGQAHYVSILQSPALRQAGRAFFLKVDSHLAPSGAYAVIQALLERFAVIRPSLAGPVLDLLAKLHADISPGRVTIASGDIAKRMFGVPIYEHYQDLNSPLLAGLAHSVAEVAKHHPPEPQHIGTRLVWRNPAAPLPMKGVAFANSFFEQGSASRHLSWWGKHLFQEFHFLWQPQVDFAYVEAHKPDLVICQTIERFLKQIPAT